MSRSKGQFRLRSLMDRGRQARLTLLEQKSRKGAEVQKRDGGYIG